MPTIKENLTRLIELVEDEPEARLDLGVYECNTACGTLHCTLGLAASNAFFQLQGVSLYHGELRVHGRFFQSSDQHAHLSTMFGPWAYSRLFKGRGNGTWDDEFLAEDHWMTDKDLALARLRRQLHEA